ncbi:hypothetical protein ACSFE6_11975 [Pseudomonas baetica]|uniref:hypothetical protein n=1 Tax=Pseudomonas baetica TaxID=674054 RepID=UPI003EEAF365
MSAFNRLVQGGRGRALDSRKHVIFKARRGFDSNQKLLFLLFKKNIGDEAVSTLDAGLI